MLFVIVEYIVTMIKVMQIDMRNIRIEEFKEKATKIIDLQCEVIDIQNIFVDIVAPPILWLELASYALA